MARLQDEVREWPNFMDLLVEAIRKEAHEGPQSFFQRYYNNSLFGIPLDEVDKVVEADSADSHSRRSRQ